MAIHGFASGTTAGKTTYQSADASGVYTSYSALRRLDGLIGGGQKVPARFKVRWRPCYHGGPHASPLVQDLCETLTTLPSFSVLFPSV